eukprot:TRINITY_DN15288_c0_g1_i2.p1 TRINITY_DN15288_c0_g1~~TRINITY_DN15288_c0_g1_i2.p1  ORF type:complete len:290 (-),score=35.97 TRINITY_DN15288_c0_g1_i2:125-994(-)
MGIIIIYIYFVIGFPFLQYIKQGKEKPQKLFTHHQKNKNKGSFILKITYKMWNLITANRICNQKDIFLQQNKHISKVLNARSQIDNRTPYKPTFFQGKVNGCKQLGEIKFKTETENRSLLYRLTKISRNQGKFSKGVLDQQYNKFRTDKFKQGGNEYVRKMQLKQVENENRKQSVRIQSAQGTYSYKRWIEARKQNERFLNSLSKVQSGQTLYNLKLKDPRTVIQEQLQRHQSLNKIYYDDDQLGQRFPGSAHGENNIRPRPQTSQSAKRIIFKKDIDYKQENNNQFKL